MWIRFLDDDIAYVSMQWAWMDPQLVAVSVAISIFTAMLALWLTSEAQQGIHPKLTQAAATLSLGGGAWAMHFVGMEAFTPCGSGSFSMLHGMLSAIPSLLAAWCVVKALSAPQRSWFRVLGSGAVLGLGVAVMHFWGMRASEATHYMDYPLSSLVLALLLGMALSMFAVTVYCRMQAIGAGQVRTVLLSGGLMGLATASLHYIAMDAIHLPVGPDPTRSVPLESHWTPLTIWAGSCLLLGVLMLALSIALRWRQLFADIQRSEARLRAVVETAVDGIIMIEGNGSIVSFNPAAERLLGWTAQEVIGRNVNTLMPAPYREAHDGYLQHHLATGHTTVIGAGREVQARHKDGTVIDVRLAVGRVAQSAQSTTPLFVGFLTDIRQRKLMQTSLQRSEEQHRTLISNIPGVTFRRSADALWQPLFLSAPVEVLTGWSAEALLAQAQRMEKLLESADIASLRSTVLEALEAGVSYSCEYRLRHRDGSLRWVAESGRGVYDEQGNVCWIDGVLIDQTEAKARNAEFAGTVAAINRAVAVAEYSLDGHVLHANTHFLRMFGYTLDEVQGEHLRMFRPATPEIQAQDDAVWQALQQGQHVSIEGEARAKDGSSLWLNTSFSPILDAGGKPMRITQLVIDITASRTLSLALQAAKDKAETAAAARSTFLANMSHEIRTPMNAIIGFSEALLDTSLHPTQQRYVETVYRSARSMLRLLNDILDTAKLDKGAVSLEVEDFSVTDVCNLVIGTQRIQAEKKGLQLLLNIQSDVPPYLRGDALRVQQIVTNLMGNAVKFTEQGYVRLAVAYADGVLHLAIQDTGIGIDAQQLEHIFAPFAQADVSTTRRFGGTGLGTTISRQLAQLMGGQIQVKSTPGQGTEFCVSLPLVLGRAPRKSETEEKVELPALRILAADDVPQNLELLQVVMQRYGHQLQQARNGLEAVQLRQSQAFDVILMDLQMPEMDGFEASRTIRAWEAKHGADPVAIIALSASVLEQDRRASGAAGMDGFAMKPLEPDKLMQEIARVLKTRSATRVAAHLIADTPASQPMDGSVADWASGMKLWGDAASLRAAWARFMAEQHGRMQELHMLVQLQDAATASAIVHRMRGAAGNLALTQLHAVLGEMEEAARSRAITDFDQLLPSLGAALAQVEALLRATEPEHVAGEPAVVSSSTLSREQQGLLLERLQAFATVLQAGEIDEPSLHKLRAVMEDADLAALQAALDMFDLDQALQCVQVQMDVLSASLSIRTESDVLLP